MWVGVFKLGFSQLTGATPLAYPSHPWAGSWATATATQTASTTLANIFLQLITCANQFSDLITCANRFITWLHALIYSMIWLHALINSFLSYHTYLCLGVYFWEQQLYTPSLLWYTHPHKIKQTACNHMHAICNLLVFCLLLSHSFSSLFARCNNTSMKWEGCCCASCASLTHTHSLSLSLSFSFCVSSDMTVMRNWPYPFIFLSF